MESTVTRRALAASLSMVLACGLAAAGCSSDDGSGSDDQTLTYWASNQGTSLENDEEILTPELEKFTKETGIEVELEVISWDNLLNRILAATTSGEAPDVLNIGNTWSASLQATGAFVPFDEGAYDEIGGEDKFLETSLTSTGAEGETPTSVPLYGLAYGLFYNKKVFADAGIKSPPTTWEELLQAGQQITDPDNDVWGLTIAGASYTESVHFAFMFGRQQGTDWFDDEGEADFTSDEAVAAVQQYVDLIGDEGIVNPSAAQNATTQEAVDDFTSGQAGMIMAQNNTEATIRSNGMKPDEYGVVPIPFPATMPSGGEQINSHVAGINMSVFVDSNEDAAMQFVDFMTSPEEQVILNKAFGSLPVTEEAAQDPAFQTENLKIFNQVLAETAATMPMIPDESQFETTVGNAVNDLIAQAATGDSVTSDVIEDALSGAEQQMASGG